MSKQVNSTGSSMVISQRRFLNESTNSVETPKTEGRSSITDIASPENVRSNFDVQTIKKLNKEIEFLRTEKNSYKSQIERLEEEVADLNDEMHSVQQKHKQELNNLLTQIDVSILNINYNTEIKFEIPSWGVSEYLMIIMMLLSSEITNFFSQKVNYSKQRLTNLSQEELKL